jgi:hypothetical protein
MLGVAWEIVRPCGMLLSIFTIPSSTPATVPEPPSLVLFGPGLLILPHLLRAPNPTIRTAVINDPFQPQSHSSRMG